LAEGTKGFLHTQPNLMRTLMIGVCGVLLVMFVLRPVAGQVTATLREPVLLGAGAKRPGAAGVMQIAAVERPGALGEAHEEGSQTQLQSRGLEEIEVPAKRKPKNSAQVMFDTVSDHIKQDAMPSTRLLQSWIAPADGE
jgi:flagellar M-ring protein FliF